LPRASHRDIRPIRWDVVTRPVGDTVIVSGFPSARATASREKLASDTLTRAP